MGEDVACRALRRAGYAVLARRFRTRNGEIDIVARDRGTVVFVEVKTRRSRAFGLPVEAVTARKQAKIVLMASEYLARRGWVDLPCRFDIVSVTVARDGRPTVEIIRGAFEATAWRR